MVIDKITDSRDSHFTIYKQVEASGLAFAELGKVGYKLELTKDIVLDEIKAAQDIHKWDKEYDNPPKLEDDKTIVTNINYWLDKVFPNQKDENNNVTKWLTPWCYEIRMDWRYYAENRDSSKIYDDAFISNWAVQGVGDKATLVPTEKTEQQEKARLIDCKNSNKYNITQDIAEAFEVFCRYEYKCDQNGKFIKTYTDDKGKVWTGRKVIFYNRAIKQEDPIVVDYQKNLQSIERTSDSSEIYTKLYVTKLEAEEMSNGYVTIADTTANPLRDEFILNFDYLDNTGALNDYQRQFIGLYKTGIAEANRKLIPLLEAEEEGVADLVELKAKASFYEHEETAAQEEYKYYKDLYDNFNKLGPVVKDKDNSYSAIFVEETKDSNCYYTSLGLYGINAESIKLYPDSNYVENKILNNANNTKIVYSVPNTLNAEEVDNNLYIQLNEYGYPKRLYCHKGSIFNVGTAYLGLEYTPENEYETIYQYFENKILAAVKDKAEYENIVAAKVEELKKLEESVQALLKLKDDLNSKLERILGPALREGYWTPDEYEDHASQVIEEFENSSVLESFWDTEAYSFETDGSYFINGVEGGRKYYPYIKLSESGIDFSNNAPNKLILYENGELQSAPITTEIPAGWKWFQIGDVRYYINLPKQTPPAVGEEQKYFIFIKDNDNVSFTLPDKTTYTLADSGVFRTTVPSGDAVPNPIPELRPAFDNINRNWTAHYYGVHFKYGYINKEPCIILLTEDGNSLNSNSYFSYSFEGDNPTKDVIGGYVCNYDQSYTVEHARIRIKEKNVQTTSSLFTIVNLRNEKILERYKDYVVIISDSYPIITLKPNEKNSLDDIRGKAYKIGYTSSKANEYMYLDAIQVAKDNSIPRYTYSLQIANLPHDFSHIELGQMLYINDHSLGVHAATGYVNKIEYALDQPQEDGVEVQNYKTKFEDLFSTITAQSEAMKTNRRAYEIAAQAFTSTANGGVMGQISGSVLQSALKNNSYLLNWSATGVEITPDQGIILTNKTPYSNGVTGQVILQGGGIFLSDSVDANGNRIWSQAITPHGINASLINAGQLNTDKILVYAGDNMAFQWNPEGIHAYKIDENGLHKDIYVKYSQHGLHLVNNSLGDWGDNLIDGMKSLVTINWDGLTLKNNNGETTLFADRDGNLSITGTLQSARFASGILGYGWQIRNDGTAEFQDVHVRGTISASVFEYKETTAVGGELYVGPTLVVDYNRAKDANISMNDYGSGSRLVLEVDLGLPDSNNLCGRTWKIGDVLGINCCLVNDAGTKYEIKNLRMRLDTIGKANSKDRLISSTLWDTSLNVFYNEDGIPVKFIDVDWKGLKASGPINCIFIGSENDTTHNRKGILLTAMAENSPYMDIYDDALSKVNGSLCGVAPKVRLGNLDGLGELSWKDSFGAELKMTPSGYGLYADNVYLTGTIYATSGKIGSLTIQDVETGHGQLSLKLTNNSNFIYTSQTTSYGFNCEVYFANKRITKKSDLPDIYKDVKFTFSYQYKPESGNWGSFNDGTWNNIELFDSDGNIVNLEFKSSEALTNTYKATIRLDKTLLAQSIIDSPAYAFSYVKDGPQGESGSTITGSSSVYLATKDDTKPANNANWKSTIKETDYSSITPYLWQKTTYTYSKGEPIIIISLISRYGETGDPARNYKLVADYNSITRELGGSYMPGKITIKCNYTNGSSKEGVTDTDIKDKGFFEVKVISYDIKNGAIASTESDNIVSNNNITISNGIITLNNIASLLSTYSKAANITVQLYSSTQKTFLLDSISFPISIGEALNDLGMLQKDTVVINKGKVIAESIVAGAITAGKIQAGAITAGALGNVGTLRLFSTGGTIDYPKVEDPDYWTDGSFNAIAYDNKIAEITQSYWDNATSGIQLSKEGIILKSKAALQIETGNLTIDEAGNVAVTGAITATSGSIGGWNINKEELTARDNSLIFKPADTYSTDENENIIENNYVLAIYENQTSKFAINTSGIVTGVEGTFTNFYTDNMFINGISVMPSIYTEGDEPGSAYAKKGVIWLKKAGSTGGSSGDIATSDKVTYQFVSNWGNSKNMLKNNSYGTPRTATLSRTTAVKLADKSTYNYSLTVPIRLKWGKTTNANGSVTYYKGGGMLHVEIQDANGGVIATLQREVRCDQDGGLTQNQASAAVPYKANFTGTLTTNYTTQQNLKVYMYVTPLANYHSGNVLSPSDGSVFTLIFT